MNDSIETSEREALRLFDDAVRNLPPVLSMLADDRPPAADPPTAQRLQQLADAVRLALVFLKDDQATADDRDLVVAELERCVGVQPPGLEPQLLFNGQRIEPLPERDASGEAFGAGLTPFKSGGLVPGAAVPHMLLQFLTPPLPGETVSLDLLQRQPPKGWGLYRVMGAHEILVSKPNGDRVPIRPNSDPLLYQLASDMLAECGL